MECLNKYLKNKLLLNATNCLLTEHFLRNETVIKGKNTAKLQHCSYSHKL